MPGARYGDSPSNKENPHGWSVVDFSFQQFIVSSADNATKSQEAAVGGVILLWGQETDIPVFLRDPTCREKQKPGF